MVAVAHARKLDEQWRQVTAPSAHETLISRACRKHLQLVSLDRDEPAPLNRDHFVRGTDIQDIFAQLGVTEATHAFYLGKELAKARLAITLGKTYRQEGSLSWGYLTPPDDVKSEHVRLTQRSARANDPRR